MRKIFLIAGPTGAGKTTYALKLADELNAVRFSIDDWTDTLFMPDRTSESGFHWFMERIGRCETLIWELSQQVLKRGKPVVLDLGFTTFEHREKFRVLTSEAGYEAELHYVDAPSEMRWERVQTRNSEQGKTYRMEVTRQMFDFMEELLEPPTDEELKSGRIIHV